MSGGGSVDGGRIRDVVGGKGTPSTTGKKHDINRKRRYGKNRIMQKISMGGIMHEREVRQ